MDNKVKGGVIERGKITAKDGDAYAIASLDRDGIELPPMKPIDSEASYSVGNMVYYFAFKDGTGRIICEV